ncbi:MAG TPA: hypothetical protein VID48_13630 [Solirubrobacteraceae bacterium]|jgi:hypothetical protein
MTERDPFEDAQEKPECTKVQLRGPNVTNSLDKPPRQDALKAQEAAIRKHLQEQRDQSDS